ncbi:hypothetical protein J6590_091848 [Homalodisca vitripennis]|nr:hypothetical protein J6590_091848 [Homalodisca vitripennis]
MKSPGPAQSTSSSTLPLVVCSTPSSSVRLHNACFSLSSATANFSPHASAASTPSSAAATSNAALTPTQPATPTPTESSSLKTQVAELRKQLHDVWDYTIESDRCLLQFTDELFVIEPGEQRSTDCKSSQCTEVRDLVSSLKTTIEVLEAEIELLRSGNSSCTCKEAKEENSTQWTHEQNKNKHKRQKKQFKQKKRNTETPVTPVVFSTVTVEGDSHVRSLAGLVQSFVTAKTSVLGGANDVGACESSTIFQHLQQQIIVRTSAAKAVVSTVPYRHDLSSDHPINKQTILVNHYIKELCSRCEGSELLNFITIGRRHFTHHGQHLTMGGKRLLARLVVDGLKTASLVSVGRTQPPPSLPLPSSAAPAGSPSIATAEPQSPRQTATHRH